MKHLKKLLSPIMMAFILAAPQMIQAMEGEEEKAVVLFPNSNLFPDVEGLILETAVKDGCNEFGFAGNIGSVCTTWNNFFNEKRYSSPLYKNIKVGLQTKCLYDMFCNGELIFRPTLGSDEGMIRLKICDLANPIEDTFNLFLCGDVGNYLSISTGYRKEKIAENENKVEIWFAPREFIKQELKEGRAQQFAGIFPNWKPEAQVGIFWTWANDDNLNWFDYLTSKDNLSLMSKNLYENCGGALGGERRCVVSWGHDKVWHKKFHVHFK